MKFTIPTNYTGSVNITQATYNVNGGAQAPLALSINGNIYTSVLIEGDVVNYTIVISYDGCPSETYNITCDQTSRDNPDCSNIFMNLICVVDTNGCVTFRKNGYLPYDFDDYVKYRCSMDNGATFGPWKLWDGETPICGCDVVQGQWFANFCDGKCPFTCSPITTCDACQPFNTGTLEKDTFCNTGDV